MNSGQLGPWSGTRLVCARQLTHPPARDWTAAAVPWPCSPPGPSHTPPPRMTSRAYWPLEGRQTHTHTHTLGSGICQTWRRSSKCVVPTHLTIPLNIPLTSSCPISGVGIHHHTGALIIETHLVQLDGDHYCIRLASVKWFNFTGQTQWAEHDWLCSTRFSNRSWSDRLLRIKRVPENHFLD